MIPIEPESVYWFLFFGSLLFVMGPVFDFKFIMFSCKWIREMMMMMTGYLSPLSQEARERFQPEPEATWIPVQTVSQDNILWNHLLS